jgi:hypothetical protein
MSQDKDGALEAMYQQVAAQHDKIDDFRAKLLGFLPVVTGIGLAVLSRDLGEAGRYTAFFGILGVLSTAGLFVHELRGIIDCCMLIAIGCELEHKLTSTKTDVKPEVRWGPFSSKLCWGFGNVVSRETAALIIYPTAIATWAFIAIDAKYWSWAIAFFVLIVACLIGERTLAGAGKDIDAYLAKTGDPGSRVPPSRPLHDYVDSLLKSLCLGRFVIGQPGGRQD